MPAPTQRHVTCFMRRMPPRAEVAAARAKGHALPPAKPLGTFQVPSDTVDRMKGAARSEAAKRLRVDPSKLIVNIGPAAEHTEAAPVHQILVYAPEET